MKKSLALICTLVLAPALAACGDDEEGGGNGDRGGAGGAVPTEQATEPETAGGREEAQKSVEVRMQNIEFRPQDVTVARGGTVRWTNAEAVSHDVTKRSGPGPKFSSGRPGGMNKGDTYERSFSAPGKIDYFCTVHPNMTGTITVK